MYQQDQGTKAKPIDHYQLMIHPNLHIGQPLFGFDTMEHQTYYPVRTITGSETSSLIGAFKQGKYENLIVFADAYFDKIKDYWKTTDMNTGEKIKTSDAVLEENIHEWPTKLVLANVPEKYQKKADQLTIDFAKQHAYDESFDSLVKSTYTKTEAAKKRQMERILECVMNWICAYYFICDQYAPTSYEGSDGTAGYAETVSVHEPSGNESQGTDLHREKGNQPVCDDPICYCRYSYGTVFWNCIWTQGLSSE